MRKVSQILRITAPTLPHHEPPAHPQMRYMRVFLKSAGIERLSERLYQCALKSLHTIPSHSPLVGHFMTSSCSRTLVGQKTMMSPTSHHLPKARIMYTHHSRTSVAHPPVWSQRCILNRAAPKPPCAFRCPRRWPLQRFHNDRKPKCHTCH